MVLSLDQKYVDVLLLGSDLGIQGGDLAEATGQRLNIPVGFQFLGRVIDPLGNPLMNDTPIVPSEYRPVEKVAPGVTERAPVDTPLYTGTKYYRCLFPLGRGQRELIVGDRQIGKTTLALDTILQQRETNVACIYVSIGQKKASVMNALEILENGGVMPKTTVIVASPDDPPALRYLAPYTGVIS
jgi:F-type H+-transporting ATPase subunit alpha